MKNLLHRSSILAFITIASLGSACNGDVEIGVSSSGSGADEISGSGTSNDGQESGGLDQGTAGDTLGTDTAGTDTLGTDSAGTDTAGTDTAGTDSAGTDSGSDTSGTATDTGSTDTGGVDVCDPQLLDLPCLVCIKASCCPQIDACLFDAACSCAYDCVTMGGDPQQCQIDCSAINNVTNALLICGQLNCAVECIP